MVLPNKFPIQLSEEVEAIELKTPEPEVRIQATFVTMYLLIVIM